MSLSARPAGYRVCNTPQLTNLVSTARASRLSRVPDLTTLDLDPDGLHIVGLMLQDHHGEPRAPHHHRALALVKAADRVEPVQVLLDVLDKDWQGRDWVQ